VGWTLRETGRLYIGWLGAQDAGVGRGFTAGEKALHSSCGERTGDYRINGVCWTLRETGRLYIGLLGAQDAGVGRGFAAGGGYPTHNSCHTIRLEKALHSSCGERAGDYRINGVGERAGGLEGFFAGFDGV